MTLDGILVSRNRLVLGSSRPKLCVVKYGEIIEDHVHCTCMSLQKQFNDFKLRFCFQRASIDSQIKMLLSSAYLNSFKTACKVHCNRIRNFFLTKF